MSRAKKMVDALLKQSENDVKNISVQENKENNLNMYEEIDIRPQCSRAQALNESLDTTTNNIISNANSSASPTILHIDHGTSMDYINMTTDAEYLFVSQATLHSDHSSDIIEPSEDDNNLYTQRSYTTLQNVASTENYDYVENESPVQENDDFSPDTDDDYHPNPDSYTCELDNTSVDTNHDEHTQNVQDVGTSTTDTPMIINENTGTEPSTSGLQQNTLIKRKQKVFPPKEHNSKKRRRNPEQWKKKAAALARQKGEEYLSYKNSMVPKKDIKEGVLCHEKCRLKCSEKFSLDQRKRILNEFYLLDVNGKNALLFNSLVSKPIARQRKGSIKHKTTTYKYFVTQDGTTQEVCKLGLCALYQIGRKKVDIIKEKIKSGASAPAPDQRGRHSNRPHKMDSEVRDKIKNHISSFPADQSHYSRNNNAYKLYLSPLLNLTKMYNLYIESCNAANLPDKFKIQKSTYNNIFVTEFNLSFGYPRSDTCSTCDAEESTAEHKENHHAAVEAMRCDRENAKQCDEVIFITIDLQQTMPLPKIPTSKAFYLRQIWFYNFGIHVVTKSKEGAFFCTWTEDIADRGSVEIASSLLRFVEIECSTGNQRKDNIVIWSDSCAGQNKNFNMICLYQYMILKGYFKTIDHKFPEVGHSYLDSDRDFGRIEKVLRKHETVLVPDQYREIICKASRLNQVINMTGHFRKISCLQQKLNLVNRKKDVNKDKVNFRDGIRWIRVEEFGSYLFKETYDVMTPFKKVDILKRNSRPDDFIIERVTENYGTIKTEKKDNIKEQLKFVKAEYRYFYEDILKK